MNNSIFTIRPFKKGSVWVFSEETLGIFEEPFVGEINQMIDAMLHRANLPASEPFTGLFSSSAFPGHHMRMQWMSKELGGNWYQDIPQHPDHYYREGWLCPVLFKFFCEAPKNIYVRAEP